MPPAQLLAVWLGVKAFRSLHLSFPKWHVKITTPGSQKDDVMGLLETPTTTLGQTLRSKRAGPLPQGPRSRKGAPLAPTLPAWKACPQAL